MRPRKARNVSLVVALVTKSACQDTILADEYSMEVYRWIHGMFCLVSDLRKVGESVRSCFCAIPPARLRYAELDIRMLSRAVMHVERLSSLIRRS